MKTFLIGSCLIGLMMTTAPVMADSYKRHWNKSRYHRKYDHGTRYRFRYNSGSYPIEHQVLQGAQLPIDVTR
ncbi:MAG: hypothetical protein ABR522_14395 [Marinobacter sp.]